MISLASDHPDLESFITIKSDLKKLLKANISVRFFDDFMKAVHEEADIQLRFERDNGAVVEKNVNAKELFTKFVENNWDYAEPGALFWDRVCSWSMLSEDEEFEFAGLNPCVTGDTLVLTENGYLPISELVGNTVSVWNGYTFSNVVPEITGHDQKIMEVTFSDGSCLKCTPYHRFNTWEGFAHNGKRVIKTAAELIIGDKLEKYEFPTIEGTTTTPTKVMYTQGFYSGDGYFDNYHSDPHISLYGEKMSLLDELSYEGARQDRIWNGERTSLKLGSDINPDKKFVPNANYNITSRLEWFAGLVDSDGTKNSADGSIAITSIDRDFLLSVKYMLSTLGVHSSIGPVRVGGCKQMPDGSGGMATYNCSDCYRLSISAHYVERLLDMGLHLRHVVVQPNTNRNAGRFVKVTSVTMLPETADKVYCFNEPINHTGCFNGVVTRNCGEEPLPAGGSCLLGSFNLSEYFKDGYFDFATFEQDIRTVVPAMNKVLDDGLDLHPLQIQRDSVRDWRQIGIGIMGLADLFIKCGIKYGSYESIELSNQIASWLIDAAIHSSALLASVSGPYPKYNADAVMSSAFYHENTSSRTQAAVSEHGLRNSQLLCIAPTGTLSTMLGVSGGIEPIFATSYIRRTESLHQGDYTYKIFTPIIKELMDDLVIDNEDDLPDYVVTSGDIPWKNRIDVQAAWQLRVDAAISSTINLPQDTDVEEIRDLYLYAWKRGLKGVTIYRKGCKREGILTDSENTAISTELERGYWKPIAPDTTYHPTNIHTGCGKLKLMIGYSPTEKSIQDFYVIKSGQGGCERTIQSLIITMSGMIRLGGTVDNIEQAFDGVGGCSAFVAARKGGKKVSKGNNCGSAILYAVKEFCADRQAKPVEKSKPNGPLCPECSGFLLAEAGCFVCKECGYSKCG